MLTRSELLLIHGDILTIVTDMIIKSKESKDFDFNKEIKIREDIIKKLENMNETWVIEYCKRENIPIGAFDRDLEEKYIELLIHRLSKELKGYKINIDYIG